MSQMTLNPNKNSSNMQSSNQRNNNNSNSSINAVVQNSGSSEVKKFASGIDNAKYTWTFLSLRYQ